MPVRDTIHISDLTVDCVVGVYPHERDTPQPLTVDVAMRLDTEPAAAEERLVLSVDYALVAAQVAFLLRTCKFRLLETAAHALAKYLLAPPPAAEKRGRAESVTLRLTKHGALDGHAVPALEIERDRRWAELGREHKGFGTVDVVHETRDAGIYRLNLDPGGAIPLHVHHRMREAEMVLTEGLLVQGREVAPGTVHRWPRGAPHRYDNPTDRVQTVLCVDSPPFLEEDEIAVDGEPAAVVPENAWGAPMPPEAP